MIPIEVDGIISKVILEFEINLLPPLQNQLNTMHWAKRARAAKLITGSVLAFIPPGFRQKRAATAKLTLTRFSTRKPDFDGMVGSWKSCLDALVKLGVIKDDSPDVIGNPTYLWEKAEKGKGRIKVKVEFE